MGGQSAGKCTSPRSTFRLTGNNAAGTLRCSNPGAGSVYSSVAERYKARAEAQSRASGGRVVHYSIPLRANTLVEASALAAVEVKALVDGVQGERTVGDCVKPHSFPSGTQVLLADGTHRSIEDIRTGDRVTATDPGSGLTAARPVTNTITTDDDKNFTRLTLTTGHGAATLTATDNHPVWLTNTKDWADAADIRIGDEVRSPTGASLRVAGVLDQQGRQRTHDLTVGGLHTYYVLAGGTPVLVHNSGGACKEVVLDRFDSFEQARNKALELLGKIDPATRQPYIGRLESAPTTYGKVVGFTTRVNGEFKRFRMDYDPEKGPHINVEIGKGDSARKWAVPWKGTEEDFAKTLGGNS
ncbi:hypothetical protein GTY51_07980 [Streptomyces sp. SID4936]|nr:hypothetical protein [Streptomyces sp. SID4936]